MRENILQIYSTISNEGKNLQRTQFTTHTHARTQNFPLPSHNYGYTPSKKKKKKEGGGGLVLGQKYAFKGLPEEMGGKTEKRER